MKQIFRILTVAVLLLLCTALLLPTASVGAAEARVADASAADTPTLPDYTNPASEAVVELSASAFLQLITGETISDAEASYVDSMLAGSAFRYHDAIPPRYVETTYEDSVLLIKAYVYTYTTAAGEEVVWTPTSVSLVGTDIRESLVYSKSYGAYMATLLDVAESEGTLLEVAYTCSITVTGESSEPLLNYAYRYAERLFAEREAYDTQLAAYELYQAYLVEKEAYDTAKAAYDAYVIAKETYDRKYAAYLVYEADMALYREQLAAYEAYVKAKDTYDREIVAYRTAYATYTAEQNAYLAAREAYVAYLAEVQAVKDKLVVVESIFAYNSEGKQMYATLMGDSVARAMTENKSALVAAGCDPDDIDTAGRATTTLQNLLTEYSALRDTPDLSDDLAFYNAHYTELRDNYTALFGALKSLFNHNKVRMVLKNEGKFNRYIEFLTQLYVISTGLDDDNVRDPTWEIQGAIDESTNELRIHTVLTELEECQRPADRNTATPDPSLTCPAPVAEPTPPAAFTLTEPTAPTLVAKPTEPDLVQKPTEPTPVEEPTAPAPVADPGDRPIEPTYTATGRALLTALSEGTLVERTAEDVTLTFDFSVQKRLSLYNNRTVDFYDADGKTLLFSVELEINEPIPTPDVTPSRPTTAQHTYTFQGWKNEAGELVTDLGVADEPHKSFYASYETTIRHYTVTWLVNGAETTADYPYGAIPTPAATPTREADARYSYTFTGWRIAGTQEVSELAAVVRDVTYEAVFEATLRQYTVTWLWYDGGSRTERLPYGSTPTAPTVPARPEDDRFVYTFSGWDKKLEPVTGDITYTATYDAALILAPWEGDGEISLTVTEDRYTATLPDGGLRVDHLFQLALLRDRSVELNTADGTLTLLLNEAMLTELSSRHATYIRLVPTERAGAYTLSCTDQNGNPLKTDYTVTLLFRGGSANTCAYTIGQRDLLFSLSLSTREDGVHTVKLPLNTTVLFRDEYAITLTPVENALLSTGVTTAPAGATVTISLTHADDLEPSSICVVGAVSGTEYPVGEDHTFLMPAEPVNISATMARKTFTVTFVADGEVIFTGTFYKGDTVPLPDPPEKAPQDGLIYTFSGWSPMVGAVNADITYEAVFSSSPEGNGDLYVPRDSKNREYLIYVWAGLALLILGAMIALPIVLITRLRKRKRRKAADGTGKN